MRMTRYKNHAEKTWSTILNILNFVNVSPDHVNLFKDISTIPLIYTWSYNYVRGMYTSHAS